MEPLSYRFFTVHDLGAQLGAQRHAYAIKGRGGVSLGSIEFYEPWRQWIVAPARDTAWSAGCLGDLQDALRRIGRQSGIEPSTERLTGGDQLTADVTEPAATQADAESAETSQ